MSNINELGKEICSGCVSCKAICPQNAISETYDEEGFIYPYLNTEKCINCGLCKKKCPQINRVIIKDTKIFREFLAYVNNDEEIVKSSSGAIASHLYKKIVMSGGYIVGVRWMKSMNGRAEYILTNNIDDIEDLRGSKYVQAEKRDIINRIEEVVISKKKILIIGLPCEIASFRNFFCDYNNVYFCDLICFGPTSTKFFQDYLNDICRHMKSSIIDIRMRFKKDHKERPHLKLVFKNGKTYIKPFYKTDIGLAFTILGRKNCSKCQYMYKNSIADISLGDCVDDTETLYNGIGLSRILVHTERGMELLKLMDNLVIDETFGKSELFFANRKSRMNGYERNIFAANFLKNGYKYAVGKKYGIVRRWINALKNRG